MYDNDVNEPVDFIKWVHADKSVDVNESVDFIEFWWYCLISTLCCLRPTPIGIQGYVYTTGEIGARS